VKERRGTVGRLTGLAESVAASARRRQRDRGPRVLLYDVGGHPRIVPPGDPRFDALVRAAEHMIGLAEVGAEAAARDEGAAGRPSTGGVSVPEPRGEWDSY
jgi:hypothetical protein